MNRSLIRSTYLLYLALLLGQFVFCLIVIFMLTQPDSPMIREGTDYLYLGLLVIFMAGSAAMFVNQLRNKQISKIRANFEGKVLHYRTTVIMRSAMVEAGNLFCIVLSILERSLTPLLIFALGLLVFIYFRPRVEEIATNYQLTGEERQKLERQLKRN